MISHGVAAFLKVRLPLTPLTEAHAHAEFLTRSACSTSVTATVSTCARCVYFLFVAVGQTLTRLAPSSCGMTAIANLKKQTFECRSCRSTCNLPTNSSYTNFTFASRQNGQCAECFEVSQRRR